ncbi:hypothetical protein AV530_014836 [Patagioenas fasciata monilis]|uniref:Uncharacterized protein n=1 Tax=Patagioenas fasciata monilis TaxID=372326 RepID=A0A1V4L236_PATFA|nr:hypothetical protein AV530_014836 [Patagioenas fasciata monilis]
MYMQSPQDSIREAAVAFLGVLGQHMRAQPEKLWIIYHAVRRAIGDSGPYQEPLRPDSSGMAWRPPFTPRVVWLSNKSEDEEEKGAEAAPPLQHEEVQELQLLQADPNWELPEEMQKQEYTHVLHNPRAKVYWASFEPKDREGSTVMVAEAMTEALTYDAEAGAALLDTLVETMWRMMVTTSMTTKKVFQELLCVLEDWPLHSTSTSDGDQQAVLALAATRVLREILRVPRCPRGLKVNFPRLLLALLFQVLYSTEQMSDKVDTFWRECQEEGGLPTSPSRFIVLTVKALLCRLGYRLVAFEVERKRGWDTLLHAETHHCAMGLLARAMSGITAINVTMCQDRLQQNPNKQNNQPADKVINKKQSL